MRRVTRWFSALLAVCASVGLLGLASELALAIPAAVTVDNRIPVKFEISPEMFPASWRSGEVDAHAEPLERNQMARSVRAMDKALAKYPAELLAKNLTAIYFAKNLRFYGLSYGGTNSLDSVYIANRGAKAGFTDRFLEAAFHHEFSSILLRNFPDEFDHQAWTDANRAGFSYHSDGTQAVRSGRADTTFRPEFHAQGFLNEYATASVEEDFNTFAEAIFLGDRKFWKAVDLWPRLHAKAMIVIRFYGRRDSNLTEEYFRSLSR